MRAANIIRQNITPDEDCRFAPLLYEISDDRLINLYFQTLDWCMEKGFPTEKILKKIGKIKGVYYKNDINLTNPKKAAIFNCKGTIELTGFTVAQIFVRDSEVKITVNDYAIAIVYAVNSEIEKIVNDNGKIFKI